MNDTKAAIHIFMKLTVCNKRDRYGDKNYNRDGYTWL